MEVTDPILAEGKVEVTRNGKTEVILFRRGINTDDLCPTGARLFRSWCKETTKHAAPIPRGQGQNPSTPPRI
jgi:hypothetical protein